MNTIVRHGVPAALLAVAAVLFALTAATEPEVKTVTETATEHVTPPACTEAIDAARYIITRHEAYVAAQQAWDTRGDDTSVDGVNDSLDAHAAMRQALDEIAAVDFETPYRACRDADDGAGSSM